MKNLYTPARIKKIIDDAKEVIRLYRSGQSDKINTEDLHHYDDVIKAYADQRGRLHTNIGENAEYQYSHEPTEYKKIYKELKNNKN